MTLEEEKKLVARWMGWRFIDSKFQWKVCFTTGARVIMMDKWNPHKDRDQLAQVLKKIDLAEIIKDADFGEGEFLHNYIRHPEKIWKEMVEYCKPWRAHDNK